MDGRLLKVNIRDKGGSWLNQPKKILAEGWQCGHTLLGRWWRVRNLIRQQGWEVLAKLSMILSKVGKCRDRHRSPKVEAQLQESSEEPEYSFIKESIFVTPLYLLSTPDRMVLLHETEGKPLIPKILSTFCWIDWLLYNHMQLNFFLRRISYFS